MVRCGNVAQLSPIAVNPPFIAQFLCRGGAASDDERRSAQSTPRLRRLRTDGRGYGSLGSMETHKVVQHHVNCAGGGGAGLDRSWEEERARGMALLQQSEQRQQKKKRKKKKTDKVYNFFLFYKIYPLLPTLLWLAAYMIIKILKLMYELSDIKFP
jgi:hypothetical protein